MEQTTATGNQIVDELCSFSGRGAGTDAERRAANAFAGRLRAMGRRAEVEPTYVHPQFALVHALHAAVGIAGSIMAVSQPGIGFALVLFAATSAYLDLNTRFYLLRRLFFRRASQNVVSPGGRPEAPMRMVLVAHLDAGRSGFIYGRGARALSRRLSPRLRPLLSPWRVYFWGGLAAILPIIGLRMAGLDATWLSIVQMVPTVILIVAIFLLVDIALSDTTPGATDNASGVAAVLGATERLRAGPLDNLDVWVVLTGAAECQAEGMRSFVAGHRGNLDPASTAVVNVDSIGYGTPAYTVSEGAAISTPSGAELVRSARRSATRSPSARLSQATRSPPASGASRRSPSPASARTGSPPPPITPIRTSPRTATQPQSAAPPTCSSRSRSCSTATPVVG